MKDGTNNHGGRRPNSGRKTKPETVTISFRVLKDNAIALKKLIEALIKNFV